MTALRALAHERQNERTGQQWHAAGGKAQDSTARSRRHRLGCRRLTRVRLLHLSHAGPDLDERLPQKRDGRERKEGVVTCAADMGMTVREMFDEMSLNVTAFLEGHKGVAKLDFAEHGAVTGVDVAMWEQKASGCKLPEDLKALLQISDGLTLRWDAKLHDERLQIGCLHINNLLAMTEISLDLDADAAWFEILMGQGQLMPAQETRAGAPHDQLERWRAIRREIRAFDLDNTCTSGRVALLYADGPQRPQVWFQDLSGQWFLISRTFTDYFRVLVMHLGLPNWQYAFTEAGLDENAKRWLRFFSSERLDIDSSSHALVCARRQRFRGESAKEKEPIEGAAEAPLSGRHHTGGKGAASGGALSGRKALDLENLDKSAQLEPKAAATKAASMPKKKPAAGAGLGASVAPSLAQQRPATAAATGGVSRARRPTSATVRQ